MPAVRVAMMSWLSYKTYWTKKSKKEVSKSSFTADIYNLISCYNSQWIIILLTLPTEHAPDYKPVHSVGKLFSRLPVKTNTERKFDKAHSSHFKKYQYNVHVFEWCTCTMYTH